MEPRRRVEETTHKGAEPCRLTPHREGPEQAFLWCERLAQPVIPEHRPHAATAPLSLQAFGENVAPWDLDDVPSSPPAASCGGAILLIVLG